MLRALREEVSTALTAALDAQGYPTEDIGLERPPEEVDAVLASSVAFRLADRAESPPPVVARQLVEELDVSELAYVGQVSTQGPYVNFHPSARYFFDTLTAAGTADYGSLPDRDTSLVLEHTSANPTGPIHVGRARNPIIGDALRRILEYAGYEVETHYYVNDAGRQIAVFTWAYETFDDTDLPPPERDRIEYDLVRYYRHGTTYLENAGDADREDAEA